MVENTGLAGAPPGIWDARILDLFGTLAQSVRFLYIGIRGKSKRDAEKPMKEFVCV